MIGDGGVEVLWDEYQHMWEDGESEGWGGDFRDVSGDDKMDVLGDDDQDMSGDD